MRDKEKYEGRTHMVEKKGGIGSRYNICTSFKTKNTVRRNLTREKPKKLNQTTEKFLVSATEPILASLNAL